LLIIQSKNNVPIRLTIERWDHIILRHPELKGQKEFVMQTIADPDLIQQGDFGELIAMKFYETTPLTSKYLVIIYKEVLNSDGFIITAYYTVKPSERRNTIWKR
jgi:hypothetical protein